MGPTESIFQLFFQFAHNAVYQVACRWVVKHKHENVLIMETFFVWNSVPCSSNSFLLMLFLMLFDLLQVNDVDGWALTDQMIAALFVDYMHSHQLLFWWGKEEKEEEAKEWSTSLKKKCLFSFTLKKNRCCNIAIHLFYYEMQYLELHFSSIQNSNFFS